MDMHLSVSLFLLVVTSLGLLAPKALAQVPLYDEAGRNYEPNVWQFDAQTTYYQATANYSKDGGEYTSLPSGYDYKLIDVDFGLRWTVLRDWGVYASSRVSNAESSDKINTRRYSSLTQAVIGTDYRIYSSSQYELIPDFSLTVPLERVDTASDQVLNREGAMEFSSRLIGRARFGMFRPFAFLGFTYRDEDRASLLPYGVGTELKFVDWNLGGELRGYQTAIQDKETDTRLRREIVAAKNGAALRYYSVNPSLLETNFWLRGALGDHWSLKFGGGTSITGASTSAGWNLFAGLSFFFEPAASRPHLQPQAQPQPQRVIHPQGRDVEEFQEETTDGVDQHLFRAPAPPPPPPVDQQKKKIQKELDQTQFQIELKKMRPSKKRRN